jgi:hypothetical protein
MRRERRSNRCLLIILLFKATELHSQETALVVAAEISTSSTSTAHRRWRLLRAESMENSKVASDPQEETDWLTRARKLFGGGDAEPTSRPTSGPANIPTSSAPTSGPTNPPVHTESIPGVFGTTSTK